MPAATPIFESFFANQGFALFEYLGDGEFQLIGSWPAWCQALWGDLAAGYEKIRIGDVSPFLENFLFDAEQFWDSKSAAGSANSGNWTEREATGREIPLEASAYFLDGRRVLVVRNLSETFDQQQEIFQTARDSLLVYEKLLREIQKKEILLHCIVHDLTQPLSAMNSVFHLLDREHLSPQLKKYVKTGERESQRQELMIRGILEAFSSDLAAQNSKQEKTGEAPDLADCAQRAVRDFSTPFRDHDVGLRFGAHVKKTDSWRVAGDAARIDRIFGNLLENAMRYSPKGTTVTVGVEDQGGFVLAYVDDQGPGLPKDQPDSQIFALFSKGKSNAGKAGLGLYFCKITVERWGGAIGAETRAQGGSRFWFRLPRAEKTDAAAAITESKKPAAAEKHPEKHKPARRLRILVADDADINRELVVELLEKRGHIAIGAADGRAAVAELEKHDFDVLLIDEEMPNMTGLEATQAIRQREAGTSRHQIIIGFSGHVTEEDEARFRAAGMDALLPKPVHMQQLYEVVESAAASVKKSPIPDRTAAKPEFAAASASPGSGQLANAGAGAGIWGGVTGGVSGGAVEHLSRSTGGNQKLMQSLVEILFADAPKALARIGRAIAQNDAAEVAAAAHLLKGSLAIFGASASVESARSLEAMGRAANLREAPLDFRTLETEFARLRAELAPLAQNAKSAKPSGSKGTKKAKPTAKPSTQTPTKSATKPSKARR
jgi:signal transduction histidine kinase/HPt (histidine-containing phosphotransfer) domain-containing protein/FixJ family two-component response regulator